MKKSVLSLLILISVSCVYGQDYKLGKVSKEELQEKYYSLDSSANAVYLYKKRKTYFKYVQGKGFNIITKVHERIKVYNKDGYDWASKEILYYSPDNNNTEKVSIKDAKTFSLIDGKIKSYKLVKSGVFNEKISKYRSKKKFTMPNLSDGCIVEWEYEIYSPYNEIDNVIMQYTIPIKRFESSIEIPEYFNYNLRQLGYLLFENVKKTKRSSINLSHKTKINATGTGQGVRQTNLEKIEYKVNILETSKNNIPALIEEPYINNLNNYIAGMSYELASIKWPNESAIYFSQSWEDVAKTIIEKPSFGGQLNKIAHLKDDLAILKNELTTATDKIFGGLEYVKDKIKWNHYYGKYSEGGIRKAFKEGIGNIADINLTLVAVLRELGLNSNPVLVSTRNNGIPVFPTLTGFNYVIAVVEAPQGNILLDASEKYSLPNVLPIRTMNWNGTIVRDDKSTSFVNLGSSMISLEEINLNYKIQANGLIEGLNRTKYKNYATLNYRSKYGSIKDDEISSKIEENNGVEILNFRISNKNDISKPLTEMYKFESESGIEVIGNRMYISPLLFNASTENPFKIKEREYPIDFGSPFEEKINITLQIPEGYKVESIPEDTAVGMSDDLGKFIYVVKKQGDKIQISSIIEINEGVISSNYYLEIKEMFKRIVSKHTEKIVLLKQ